MLNTLFHPEHGHGQGDCATVDAGNTTPCSSFRPTNNSGLREGLGV